MLLRCARHCALGQTATALATAPLLVPAFYARRTKVCRLCLSCGGRYIAERASRGLRSLGVAHSTDGGASWELVGLISLLDPPRPDSAETIKLANSLGVEVKMVTGEKSMEPLHGYALQGGFEQWTLTCGSPDLTAWQCGLWAQCSAAVPRHSACRSERHRAAAHRRRPAGHRGGDKQAPGHGARHPRGQRAHGC